MLKVTEKGFTLIEVLVALTIAGAIMGVMAAAVITIVKTTTQNDEWNVNLRQVQNAGHWISRDALMAQVVKTNQPGVFLNLSWSDWDGNSDNVNYILDGNTLKRQLNGGAAILIAQYIVHDGTPTSPTKCVWIDGENKLAVTIRASLHGSRYAERIYEIHPRPVARGG